jgi:tight adherence protein B
MNTDLVLQQILLSGLTLLSTYMLVRYGWELVARWVREQIARYDRVLRHQLLLDIDPRLAFGAVVGLVVVLGLCTAAVLGNWLWFIVGGAVGAFLPTMIVRHLETKRKQRLERQLVDGVMALASGVRAGLNLIQAMELLVTNAIGPIKQEFAQLLREYQMGLELNQAMRNASNRIGLSNYRLLFTAIEMHRLRGGDTGESLDRIAESIREIQRLEGKLDALTAQGRTQARMMAAMPLLIMGIFYMIDPEGVGMLFTEPMGRLVLLIAAALILCGFLWIRRIMAVDI